MPAYFKNRELTSAFFAKHPLAYIYHKGRLVWEAVTAYIFTEDGFGIRTQDEYIIKCKDQ